MAEFGFWVRMVDPKYNGGGMDAISMFYYNGRKSTLLLLLCLLTIHWYVA